MSAMPTVILSQNDQIRPSLQKRRAQSAAESLSDARRESIAPDAVDRVPGQ